MFSKLLLLFALVFVTVNAVSYVGIQAGNGLRRVTADGKYHLRVYMKGNEACWFTTEYAKNYEPAVCLNVNTNTLRALNSKQIEGEAWHHCINVKKGTKFHDIYMFVDKDINNQVYTEYGHEYWPAKQNFNGIRAHCSSGKGCMTQYGWITNSQVTKRVNC